MDAERLGELVTRLDRLIDDEPELEWVVAAPSKRMCIYIFRDIPEGRAECEFFSEMNAFLSSVFKELISKVSAGEELNMESMWETMENNKEFIFWGTLEKIFEDIKRT